MARIDREPSAPYAPGLRFRIPAAQPEPLTLLDLVRAVAEFAASDAEVVAVVEHLIRSGQVVLVGQFRGSHLLSN
jgi:hypothetical protein